MTLPDGVTARDLFYLVFLVGNLVERFNATRASLKSQGKRIGAIEVSSKAEVERLSAMEARVSKLEGKST